jgi:hypothetical protein
MISIDNEPVSTTPSESDFTIDAYRTLLRQAARSYAVATYREIPWGHRFVLWRHDCDFSLNRALGLGRIEAAEGFQSTFFVNPHSEFYNLLERQQLDCVLELIDLGHDVGLHFDTAFHGTSSEAALDNEVQREADLLTDVLGARPAAFSFHNPSALHLTFEADTYGGLVNCYSKRFQTEVAYCSDSNGYWRFQRLGDVLVDATNPCVQVLTHPAWWTDEAMPPRQRIFRAVYGRANATMHFYDQSLDDWGRSNLAGGAESLRFLKTIDPSVHELCDFLWNRGDFDSLFLRLWRFHGSQILRFCKATLQAEWNIPAREIDALTDDPRFDLDHELFFTGVFGQSWQRAIGIGEEAHKDWAAIHDRLVRSRSSFEPGRLEEGCIYLCNTIQELAAWVTDPRTRWDPSPPGDLTVVTQDPNSEEVRWAALRSAMTKAADRSAEASVD